MKKMDKKAFTLIELLVVIAVVGILVLLGVPRFLGKTDDAIVAQMKNDVRAAETKVAELRIIEDEHYLSWDSTTASELRTLIDGDSLYGKRGPVNNVKEDEYKIIPDTYIDKEINSKLGGTFYANSDGEVFYHGAPGLGQSNTDEGEDVLPELDIPEYYVEVTDDDFLKVENGWSTNPNGPYYYLYTGDEDYVIVPEKIHGEVITDTHNMFGEHYQGGIFTASKVKGVAMDNPNITDTSNMFFGSVADSIELDYLNTENVTNMTSMFQGLGAEELDLSNFSTASAKTLRGMFAQSKTPKLDLSNFDTHNVTDMSFLFEGAKATIINVENLDTSSVTNMNGMFKGAKANIDLSNFDTSKVNTMNSMFQFSKIISIDFSSFVTSNVTDMSAMFQESAFQTLDLSMFDTRKVETMESMFSYSQVPAIDLSRFETSNVTNMSYMFSNSQATEIDLSNFDTSNVTDMGRMFYNSQATTLDLSSFDTSSATTMQSMFEGSKATTGYARTTKDIERFNGSGAKPSALKFTVNQ